MSEVMAQPDVGPGIKPHRIAVLHQGFIPSYRERFFALLNERSAHDYVVLHGDPHADSGHLPLPGPFDFPNVRVRNRHIEIGGRRLVYQPVIRRVLTGGFDALVVGHEVKFVASLLLFGLFKSAGKPAILWGHGFHRPDAALLAQRSSAWFARASDGYLAYSDSGAERLAAAGVERERITVVRNTIDISRETAVHAELAAADPGPLRQALGLRPDAQVLLYIGRLSPRKRVDQLIELVRRLNAKAPTRRVDLLIAGDGPERAVLQAQAAELDYVKFLGNVYRPEAVGRLMRVAAATVIPGAVGLAVNHSFAHGVPMITRRDDTHGPEIEFIRHGENGMIVDGGFEDFAAAVAAFLDDPALQRRFAAAALATREQLGLDYMVEQFDKGVVRAIRRARAPQPARRQGGGRQANATGPRGWRR